MNRRHIKWLPIGAALLFIAYQCHVALSAEQESALGLQSYQQVPAQSQTIDSGPDLERVQRVVQRLAAATAAALRPVSGFTNFSEVKYFRVGDSRGHEKS